MMDYCEKEQGLRREEEKEQTIQAGIQEAYKILREMGAALDEFASIVNGTKPEDRTKRDASSLWDEAGMLPALAFENLQKIMEIKNSIY